MVRLNEPIHSEFVNLLKKINKNNKKIDIGILRWRTFVTIINVLILCS